MPDLAACFEHAGWPAEELEPGVWRCTFADETGAPHDLYVLAAEEWVHLAVSPLLRIEWADRSERPARLPAYLMTALLRLNQDLRLARLALDEDGDINLLADLPAHVLAAHIGPSVFAETLELLAYYADQLAPQLWALAADASD